MKTQYHACGQHPWNETQKNKVRLRIAERGEVWWAVFSLILIAAFSFGATAVQAQTVPAVPKEKDREAENALEKVMSVYSQASFMHGKVATTVIVEKNGGARQLKGSGEFWCARPNKIRIAYGEARKRRQLTICDGKEFFSQNDEINGAVKGPAPEAVLKLPWLDAHREYYGEFWTALGLFFEPRKADSRANVELIPSNAEAKGLDLVGVQLALKNGARQRLWIDKKTGWLTEDELFVSYARQAGQRGETLTLRQEYEMNAVGSDKLPDETFTYKLPEGYRWCFQIISVEARQYPKLELHLLGTLPKEDEQNLMLFYSINQSAHIDKAIAEIVKANRLRPEFQRCFNLQQVSRSKSAASSIGYVPLTLAGAQASATLSPGEAQNVSPRSAKTLRLQLQVCEYKWPENTVRPLSNVIVQRVQVGRARQKRLQRHTIRPRRTRRPSARRSQNFR